MAKPLPKWLMERYAALWSEKKSQGFDLDEAAKILNESDSKQMNVVLSSLRKCGWLSSEFNPEDARKRIYKLRDPETIIEEITQGQSTSYDDFKNAVKKALEGHRTGLTWAQIKEKTGLKQTVPNNKWVRQLEKEIRLKREKRKDSIIWKL